jgi:hypothetical protein
MPTDIRRLITQITGVAKKAAEQASGTETTGTVISRNPDGSLNVDLGDGGCARTIPSRNVKIGEQIILGLEPSIGKTTNLSPLNHTVQPPTELCPVDPRLPPRLPPLGPPGPPGTLPPTPLGQRRAVAATGAQKIATTGIQNWESDRGSDWGNGTPSNCTTWFGYRKTAAVTSGNGSVNALYRQEVVGACPQVVLYSLSRSWIRWDLAAAGIPAASNLRAARIKFSLVPGGQSSVHDSKIVVVRGSASFPITTAQLNRFDPGRPLASFRILGGYPEGPATYGLTVELDLKDFGYGGTGIPDPFIVCLISDFDQSGTIPPQVGTLIDNQDRNDVANFYVTDPNGPPVLELDIGIL